MIKRTQHLQIVKNKLGRMPVVGLFGARQVGKTTLAKQLISDHEGETHHFDLALPMVREVMEAPYETLFKLRGLVVLDEVHFVPDLFAMLRHLADRDDKPAKFLVLGSASPDILKQGSESLAGRISYHQLAPLGIGEALEEEIDKLWVQGGFPLSFLAQDDQSSYLWRQDFLTSFVNRDLPELGVRASGLMVEKFWRALAHWHGRVFNASSLGRGIDVTNKTARGYLDLLEATYMLRVLRPWHSNIRKREIKAPKVYFRDSGLLHAMLRIRNFDDLQYHPVMGSSWEGFVIENIIRTLRLDDRDCYFWGAQSGGEIDLVARVGMHWRGFEVKRTIPRGYRKIVSLKQELGLASVDVIHAGDKSIHLPSGVRFLPVSKMVDELQAAYGADII